MKVYLMTRWRKDDYEGSWDQRGVFSSLEKAQSAAQKLCWDGVLEWEESYGIVSASDQYKRGHSYDIEMLELDQIKGA